MWGRRMSEWVARVRARERGGDDGVGLMGWGGGAGVMGWIR